MAHTFKRALKGEKTLITFNFSRIYSITGILFFITCKDPRGFLRVFRMHANNGDWVFSGQYVNNLPEWIVQLKEQLSDAIKETDPLAG